MLHHLAAAWTAIWPNLVADVLWVPIVGLSHRWVTRRHAAQLRAAVHEAAREAVSAHQRGDRPAD